MDEEQRAQIARDEEIARQQGGIWLIFEKVWDFNQHIEPTDLEHGSERMKSPVKIEEEDVDTHKEMKEVSKESGAKRKKSLPRKSTRSTVKRQKMELDDEKENLKGYLDIVSREDVAEDVESLSTKQDIMELYRLVKESSYSADAKWDCYTYAYIKEVSSKLRNAIKDADQLGFAFWAKNGLCVSIVPSMRLGFKRNNVECKELATSKNIPTCSEQEVRNTYKLWLIRHEKTYNALGEKERRFQIFNDNLKFIGEHNASGNLTCKVGLNWFADLTNEKYRRSCWACFLKVCKSVETRRANQMHGLLERNQAAHFRDVLGVVATLMKQMDEPQSMETQEKVGEKVKEVFNKVNIFAWRMILDRLPHKLNLSSRGIDIPNISCPSCNVNVESSNHIYFECDIAKDIWTLFRNWCDIPFPPFTSYEHWNVWFSSWHVVKEKSRRLSIIFTSSLWWFGGIATESPFCSHPMRKSDIFDSIRLSPFSWLHHRGRMICKWADWLKSPMLLTSNGLG
ncbi:RNA-directed DNA polymerase, eukaryota [Tanacetum coccineum]